jgi:hypothetical protein
MSEIASIRKIEKRMLRMKNSLLVKGLEIFLVFSFGTPYLIGKLHKRREAHEASGGFGFQLEIIQHCPSSFPHLRFPVFVFLLHAAPYPTSASP